jgi:outer membrane PBP1 activator LpoA protein
VLMIIARATVLVLALVACAWFVLGIRQVHEISAATSIVAKGGPISAGQARRASSLLNEASTLNPDKNVDVLRARVALAQGDQAAARQILFKVIRQEPKNLDGWIWYVQAARGNAVAFYAAQIGLRRVIRIFPKHH